MELHLTIGNQEIASVLSMGGKRVLSIVEGAPNLGPPPYTLFIGSDSRGKLQFLGLISSIKLDSSERASQFESMINQGS